MMGDGQGQPLRLAPGQVPVIERNVAGRSAIFLTCDHYGRAIPEQLGNLGLPASELNRHIAYDVGIAGVAEGISDTLDAHLVAQRYSRLVIDCNRPPAAASSIPEISEATEVLGNIGLSPPERAARHDLIFAPYHARIAATIDARLASGQPTILISLHSFTPVYAAIARPWHVGTLYQHDTVLPPLLLDAFRAEGDLVVGDNEPYAVSDETDYTIPVHGERRGLITSGIEIRQDLIVDQVGRRQWAARLARIFAAIEAVLTARLDGLR